MRLDTVDGDGVRPFPYLTDERNSGTQLHVLMHKEPWNGR